MKPSLPFLKAGYAGILVVVLSIGLTMVFPSQSPNLPEGFFTPIIAFEFLQTPGEAARMFTRTVDAKGASIDKNLLAAFDQGNRLDYLYMVLYCGFLMLFSLTCARLSGNNRFFAGAVVSLLVLAADALENIQLLKITGYFRNGTQTGELERLLELLGWFTWLKWGGIVAVFLILAPWFRKGGRFSKAVGLWGVTCALLGTAAFLHRPVLAEIFCLSVGVMFLLMIVYCFRRDPSRWV